MTGGKNHIWRFELFIIRCHNTFNCISLNQEIRDFFFKKNCPPASRIVFLILVIIPAVCQYQDADELHTLYSHLPREGTAIPVPVYCLLFFLIWYTISHQNKFLHLLRQNNNYCQDRRSVHGLFVQYLFSWRDIATSFNYYRAQAKFYQTLSAAKSPAGPAPTIITSVLLKHHLDKWHDRSGIANLFR